MSKIISMTKCDKCGEIHKNVRSFKIENRSEDSSYHEMSFEISLCEDCQSEYDDLDLWFDNELCECVDCYEFELEIYTLIKSLQVEKQEQILNVGEYRIDAQDWISDRLDEIEVVSRVDNQVNGDTSVFEGCEESYKDVYSWMEANVM